jgi:hypothetical protein
MNYKDKSCICGKEKITDCDKCNLPTCIACCNVIPVPSSVNESLIQVMHEKCMPAKHLAKLNKLAKQREVEE